MFFHMPDGAEHSQPNQEQHQNIHHTNPSIRPMDRMIHAAIQATTH